MLEDRKRESVNDRRTDKWVVCDFIQDNLIQQIMFPQDTISITGFNDMHDVLTDQIRFSVNAQQSEE